MVVRGEVSRESFDVNRLIIKGVGGGEGVAVSSPCPRPCASMLISEDKFTVHVQFHACAVTQVQLLCGLEPVLCFVWAGV